MSSLSKSPGAAGMKLAAALLGAIGGSELAWNWYSSTVINIEQSLGLIAVFAFAVLCGVLGWGLDMSNSQ